MVWSITSSGEHYPLDGSTSVVNGVCHCVFVNVCRNRILTISLLCMKSAATPIAGVPWSRLGHYMVTERSRTICGEYV